MNKYYIIFSMFIIAIVNNSIKAQDIATINYEEYIKESKAAEDEFRNYLPKIERLENKHTNDPEFLIGSALLYERYANSKETGEKIKKYWERVFIIDPNNKVALATKIRDDQYMYLQDLSLIFDELDRKIKSAQKRGSDSITIEYQINMGPQGFAGKNNTEQQVFIGKYGEKITQPATSQSQLYKYFAKGDNKDIVISDFESAKVQLKEKLNEELEKSLDIIDNAEKCDPDNALYNYLKAHIYFKLGNIEYGLEQIKTGTQKKYLRTYYPEIRQSAAKVLELIDFPEFSRQYITASYSPAAQFIRESILNEDLEPLLAEYLKQYKNEKIKEVVDMVILMKEQILHDPMPYDTLSKIYSEIIDKWIDKYKSKLSMDSSK
jgi:hypothetical protein